MFNLKRRKKLWMVASGEALRISVVIYPKRIYLKESGISLYSYSGYGMVRPSILRQIGRGLDSYLDVPGRKLGSMVSK